MKAPFLIIPVALTCLLAAACSFAGPPYDGDSSLATAKVPVAGTALDLATTLRLAGARNLDVAFARQRLIEAEGDYASERLKFFPTLAPGIGYRRHDGRTQDTSGNLLDVSKQSYAPGVSIVAELNLGEAIYKNLAAKQLTVARAEGIERQRVESMLAAGLAYYDLAFATALEFSAREDVRLSEEQESQLNAAVEAGIALKGDVLRITVQKERNKLVVRQAGELADIASTRLARTLHLDPTVSLRSTSHSLSPLFLVNVTEGNAAALVAQAQSAHPGVTEAAALTTAAQKARDAAIYGPMVPTLTAQAFQGGVGGGRGGDTGNFGDQTDLVIGLSWRFGAGGIFDGGRKKSAEARLVQSQISEANVKDKLAQLVSEAHASARSAHDRLAIARTVLSTAGQVVTLSKERKEFGVGVVLEMIQSGSELARSRQDYLSAIADVNRAQLALAIYTGQLGQPRDK